MLRPGGQLYFNAMGKLPQDVVFDKLDKGKWAKYDNWRSHSPFHDHSDARKGYEELLREIGFVDCHLSEELFITYHPEEAFKGEIISNTH